MRGKLWFISGMAAGFVLGARAGREKYEEIVTNARKVLDHPTVQEAAGVAEAQANRLDSEGKDKLSQTKVGEKFSTGGSTGSTSTSELTAADDTLTGMTTGTTSSTSSRGTSSSVTSNGTTY